MDYHKFYSEVVDWISRCNQLAMQHGMDSDIFWKWVANSTGEICKRYDNNQLVLKQMVMLFEWLDDVYAKGRK